MRNRIMTSMVASLSLFLCACSLTVLAGCGGEATKPPEKSAANDTKETKKEADSNTAKATPKTYPTKPPIVPKADQAPELKSIDIAPSLFIEIEGGFADIAFASDGSQVYLLDEEKGVVILDPTNFEMKSEWSDSAAKAPTEGEPIDKWTSLEVSREGGILATVAKSGRIYVWKEQTGELLYTDSRHADKMEVEEISISPDGKTIISGDTDWNTPRFYFAWQSETGKEKWKCSPHWTNKPADFSPNGQVAVVKGKGYSEIEFRNVDSGELLWSVKYDGDSVHAFHYFSEEALITVNFEGNDVPDSMQIACISTATGVANWVARGLDANPCGPSAVSPDGKLLATMNDHTDGKRRISLWQVRDGKYLGALHDERLSKTLLKFTPDGKLLAQTEEGILCWDATTLQKLP